MAGVRSGARQAVAAPRGLEQGEPLWAAARRLQLGGSQAWPWGGQGSWKRRRPESDPVVDRGSRGRAERVRGARTGWLRRRWRPRRGRESVESTARPGRWEDMLPGDRRAARWARARGRGQPGAPALASALQLWPQSRVPWTRFMSQMAPLGVRALQVAGRVRGSYGRSAVQGPAPAPGRYPVARRERRGRSQRVPLGDTGHTASFWENPPPCHVS